MTLEFALKATLALAGISNFVQAAELLSIRKDWSDQKGIWRWRDLRQEYRSLSPAIYGLFSLILSEKGFLIAQAFRIVSSILLITCLWLPIAQPILTLACWITLAGALFSAIRWRGAFNGGSDAMNLVVLIPLSVAQLFGPDSEMAVRVALGYIALQSVLSYWVAGFVKIREAEWRQGKALPLFLATPQYAVPTEVVRLIQTSPYGAWVASWGVMLFELTFPVVLFTPKWAPFLLGVGFVFHFANAALLGLNRFVFAWAATYPALLVMGQILAESLQPFL